jgi:hypothetical protein
LIHFSLTAESKFYELRLHLITNKLDVVVHISPGFCFRRIIKGVRDNAHVLVFLVSKEGEQHGKKRKRVLMGKPIAKLIEGVILLSRK